MTARVFGTASTAALLLLVFASGSLAQLRDSKEESLTAADGTTFTVTMGIVRVPEIRGGSTTNTIDLAVVRVRRATSTSRKAHVMLAGGPGDSGVNIALGMARQGGAALSAVIDGDVIGIDQRGTGKSAPNLSSAVSYNLPLDVPGSPEAWRPIIEPVIRSVAADFSARGVSLSAYNTREAADDVDDVRKALGYETIVVWGRSYGTHLALATLRQHPNSVERMILIGPEGPDHTWKLPSTVDRVILRIAERAGMAELPALMRRVIARLETTPVTVATTHPLTRENVTIAIGAFDLQWLTAQAMGDPRALATLPLAYGQMDAGNFQGIAPLVLSMRARLGIESVMKHATDAASGASSARRARILRETPAAILGNAINFPGMDTADAWPVADLGDAFRQPVSSHVPVLILAGDLDPRTPVENGREILATLPNGRLVVVENATHQFDVFGAPAIRLVLAEFLTTGSVASERVTLPPIRFQQ